MHAFSERTHGCENQGFSHYASYLHPAGPAICAAHARVDYLVAALSAELLAAAVAFVPWLHPVGDVRLAIGAMLHEKEL
jgi:hypothetical protein